FSNFYTTSTPGFTQRYCSRILTLCFPTRRSSDLVTIFGRPAVVSTTSAATNSYRAQLVATSTDIEGVVPFSISLTTKAGVAGAGPLTATTQNSSHRTD